MEKTQTLKETLDEISKEEIISKVHRKLILVQMLANVQLNLVQEIEDTLNSSGQYKYSVKHNLNNLKGEIKKNIGQSLFRRLSQEATDLYVDDFEELETIINKWADKGTHDMYSKQLQ